MRSNLIPITRIYDIYPKYTYSKDVAKFMDEIVDIDRANVFTKADMEDILDKIRERIELEKLGYPPSAGYYKAIMKCLKIIDKYRESQAKREDKEC